MHKMLDQQIYFSTPTLSKIELKWVCIIYSYTGWLVSKRPTRTAWICLESPYKNSVHGLAVMTLMVVVVMMMTTTKKDLIWLLGCHQPFISPTHDVELDTWQALRGYLFINNLFVDIEKECPHMWRMYKCGARWLTDNSSWTEDN